MKEFPAFVVEKFGVHNINPLLDHFASRDEAYITEFRKALDKAHSKIVDLGLGGRRFFAPEADVRREAVRFAKDGIDAAVRIGSPSVRQHLGAKGEKPDVALAAESLGEAADYGAKQNVVINLENDSPGSEDPFFIVEVIEKVGNAYLRALPDFGNSLIGHDNDYNLRAVKGMLAHAFNMCHVKETVRGHDGKQYHVDLRAMFGLARASSYAGYFSMEFDTQDSDPIVGTRQLIETTLQYLR